MTNIVDQYSVVEDGLPVKLPSGAEFTVLTQSEVEYVTDRVERYTSTYRWDNISDVQDVDRIIMMEMLVHRWSSDIARGRDVHGDETDDANLQKRIKELGMELRQTKASLGMDKTSREKDTGAESVAARWDNLCRRAADFGINRNKMMDKGLELSQQVIALATLWLNCDEQEQIEWRATAEDVCRWLVEVYTPEFQAVDEAYRQTSQKMWVGTL